MVPGRLRQRRPGRVRHLRRRDLMALVQQLYERAYRRGKTPWDTGIPPPELVEVIEGPNALEPGRALDLGCGTGTNAMYLAQHGWTAVGVDFSSHAIESA